MNDWQAKMLASAPKVDKTGRSIDRCSTADPVIVPEDRDYSDPRDPIHPSWQRLRAQVGNTGTYAPVKPLVRCKCGVLTGIGLHHVHVGGLVTQSFFHATPAQLGPEGVKKFGSDGCGWHVFLKLDGYDQGDFPPEPRDS